MARALVLGKTAGRGPRTLPVARRGGFDPSGVWRQLGLDLSCNKLITRLCTPALNTKPAVYGFVRFETTRVVSLLLPES